MTPDERAEKIVDDIGYNPNWGRKNIVNYYAAEIRKAVEEAIMTEQMRQEQSEIEKIHRAVEEAVLWKVKELSSESGMTAHWKLGFDKGKAEAYEDAAKIAEAADGWHPVGKEYANEIALAIRARAAGLSWDSRELPSPHVEDCKKKWAAGFPCAH